MANRRVEPPRTGESRLELIGRAATNNAALCDAMCRSHGVAARFDADAWVSPARTPERYPDAVTLTPAVDRDTLLDRVDGRPGCSVKDSFAVLDLSTVRGWSVLFEATWVASGPVVAVPADATDGSDARWEPVDDVDGLEEWADRWGADDRVPGLWRPELLDQDVVVLAGRRAGALVGGAVVNVTADLVGISNIFGDPTTDAWRSCLAWIADHLPGRTVVGYESGDDLTEALDHGFEPIGPLRIWTRGPA